MTAVSRTGPDAGAFDIILCDEGQETKIMRAQTLLPAVSCLALISAAPLSAANADQSATAAPADTSAQTAVVADATVASPSTGTTPTPPKAKPSSILQQPGELTLGYSDTGDKSGTNTNKLRQYATEPSGFFIEKFRYVPLSSQGNLGVVSLEDLTQPDYRDYGELSLNGGKTQITAKLANSEFKSATIYSVPTSDRLDKEYYLQQLVAPGFKLSTRYMEDDERRYFNPEQFGLIGPTPLDQSLRYSDIVGSGRFGGGFLKLAYSDWVYEDHTDALFNTMDQHSEIAYSRDVKAHSLQAQVSEHELSANGSHEGSLQNVAVSDFKDIDKRTDASVALTLDNISDKIVQNDYVNQQQSATARIAHAWSSEWRGTLAAQVRQVDEVNDDHSYINAPRWQTIEARLNGKLGQNTRVLARASSENCWNAPNQLDGEETLIWTARQTAQVRIDSEFDTVDGYFSYDLRRQSNDSTGTDVTNDVYQIGGDWQISAPVSLTADFTYERWIAETNYPGSFGLDDFAPTSDTVDLGASWTISPHWFTNANYSFFLTSNNNPLLLQDGNTDGHYLTVQIQNRLEHGRQWSLTVAPWAYEDKVVNAMNAAQTLVMLSVTTPF